MASPGDPQAVSLLSGVTDLVANLSCHFPVAALDDLVYHLTRHIRQFTHSALTFAKALPDHSDGSELRVVFSELPMDLFRRLEQEPHFLDLPLDSGFHPTFPDPDEVVME
jgi:hypothetical protein